MRIVHIEDFFHPDAGYQINILTKYQVRQGHEVIVVTSEMRKMPRYLTAFFSTDNIEEKDRLFTEKTGVQIIRRPIYGFVSGRAINTFGFKRFVDSLRPDMLYLHGDATYISMQYILRARRLRYPVIFDSHMLEMASENRLSRLFRLFFRVIFTPVIKRNRYVFIRTQDDPYVEKCLGIPLSQAPFISVGSDTLLFHSDEEQKALFRREHDISPNDFVVIYTGKLIASKGCLLLASAFEKKIKNAAGREIVLIVVGNAADEAGEKAEKMFRKAKTRVLRFPTQKYMELAKFYQAADLSVFPKQCSLSFYDAQACGLPVVLEKNNVNIGRVSYGNGFCFTPQDVNDLIDKIRLCAEMEPSEYEQIKRRAVRFVVEHYDYRFICRQYTKTMLSEYRRQMPKLRKEK